MIRSMFALPLLLATPALAIEYSCPSDPGFCYFDVGNDGCFDAGVDLPGIESDLDGGVWPLPAGSPPSPGSIICPPSVQQIDVIRHGAANVIDWDTAPGGDIILHEARLRAVGGDGDIHVDAGGYLGLGGGIEARSRHTDITLRSEDGATVAGKVKSKRNFQLWSFGGDVTLEDRTQITTRSTISIFAGAFTAGDKVKLKAKPGSITVSSSGPVVMGDSPVVTSAGALTVRGSSIDIQGKAKLTANGDREELILEGGAIGVDAIQASARGTVSITGDDVVIGRPNAKGRIATSRLNARKDTSGSYSDSVLEVEGTTGLAFEKIRFNGRRFSFDTTATEVKIARSIFLAPKSWAGSSTTTIQAGAGATCDLTGTAFLHTVLAGNCDTIVGP